MNPITGCDEEEQRFFTPAESERDNHACGLSITFCAVYEYFMNCQVWNESIPTDPMREFWLNLPLKDKNLGPPQLDQGDTLKPIYYTKFRIDENHENLILRVVRCVDCGCL